VAGVIEGLKIKRTKRGDKMAVFSLEDRTGAVDVIAFPDVFTTYAPLLKSEEPLLVSGTAEVDDNKAKIISKELMALETVRQNAIRAIELGLPQDALSLEDLEEIKDLFFRYPGDCSVLFRVGTARGRDFLVSANNRFRVLPCEALIGEIEAITGQKVICRYGKKNSNHCQPLRP
jgi:DNA polymerase-3 subunit alpha